MATLHRFAALIALVVVAAGAGVGCDGSKTGSSQATKARVDKSAEDAAQVIAQLNDDKLSTDKRLAAIHRAGDEKIERAIPRLHKLLSADDPDVVVAAAAALSQLDDAEADNDVVEAAGRLSRRREYEHLREILFVVGAIGGPASRTYLQAVADGHQVPPIRRAAAQILENLPPRKSP